ncbi:hypothetical protein GOQ27_12865 [Clostridium sp. D2Q-11]|uniref:Mor transcription activator family protein n=1 Tax=Anaeromonas frigoriresistens TaxID=2683708 RepID=A0A942ZA08_9FIRM|nr:CD3324 family protein [Anaeromonas frigoriresistens]MBS4539360.1 hypothetical protein [Anaeromonas frigoriresistens]
MRYINADEVLPNNLLEEVQKYVKGEIVYIPSPVDQRKSWGEKTGRREYFKKRNSEIKLRFKQGDSIDQLMNLFCLSYDSIKKIVYSK